MTMWIDSKESIAEVGTKMFKTSVRKWVVLAIPGIVGQVVPIPLIVVNVRRFVYTSIS